MAVLGILKACLFCNSPAYVTNIYATEGTGQHRVACSGCGAEGPLGPWQAALDAWNRRDVAAAKETPSPPA